MSFTDFTLVKSKLRKYSRLLSTKSCSIENEKIKDDIDYYFNNNVFRETDDLYDKSLLDRQFYTVPSTTIPNNREVLTSWLYDRGPSCKENNGEQCYNNLYNDIKITAHY